MAWSKADRQRFAERARDLDDNHKIAAEAKVAPETVARWRREFAPSGSTASDAAGQALASSLAVAAVHSRRFEDQLSAQAVDADDFVNSLGDQISMELFDVEKDVLEECMENASDSVFDSIDTVVGLGQAFDIDTSYLQGRLQDWKKLHELSETAVELRNSTDRPTSEAGQALLDKIYGDAGDEYDPDDEDSYYAVARAVGWDLQNTLEQVGSKVEEICQEEDIAAISFDEDESWLERTKRIAA